MITHNSFLEAFACETRSPEIPAGDDLYGWLAGGWDLDVFLHAPDGNVHQFPGEAHFAWVLEGRAVQDVFINPRRGKRATVPPGLGNWYGSTIRVFDPALRAWRVTWINPAANHREELIGRRSGNDIVQEGSSANGTSIRWSFVEITANSFRWLGERRQAGSEEWQLEAEMHARRVS